MAFTIEELIAAGAYPPSNGRQTQFGPFPVYGHITVTHERDEDVPSSPPPSNFRRPAANIDVSSRWEDHSQLEVAQAPAHHGYRTSTYSGVAGSEAPLPPRDAWRVTPEDDLSRPTPRVIHARVRGMTEEEVSRSAQVQNYGSIRITEERELDDNLPIPTPPRRSRQSPVLHARLVSHTPPQYPPPQGYGPIRITIERDGLRPSTPPPRRSSPYDPETDAPFPMDTYDFPDQRSVGPPSKLFQYQFEVGNSD